MGNVIDYEATVTLMATPQFITASIFKGVLYYEPIVVTYPNFNYTLAPNTTTPTTPTKIEYNSNNISNNNNNNSNNNNNIVNDRYNLQGNGLSLVKSPNQLNFDDLAGSSN